MPPHRIVVVGAGLAGARTCQELRSRGYGHELILLGAEPHPPYDRPPLSKALLRGALDGLGDVRVDVDLDALDVRFLRETSAQALAHGVLATSVGDLTWDALVLATGARPLRPRGDRGALVLRTVDDALALRSGLVAGARVVIVGAGWIGAEVATAAAGYGCTVTVVEAAPAPLAVPLGAPVGARTTPWYAEAGVTLRTETPVVETAPDGVLLADGEWLPADVVLAAVGVRPDVAWLAGSGVETGVGVHTDAGLRTSLSGVLAVGDCATRFSPRAGRRLRLEHWDDALHSPEVVAATLLGEDATYDPVPYVWSEQFGRYVQWVGWRTGDPAVWRGDPADGQGWAAGWLDGSGRLTGFLAVDRQRDLLQARKLIAAGRQPDPARLADPAVPVRDA
jgi:NADPH-dependent 2,4-dienoyl-CoA reductase/sulfur reductase-like enzyme